MLVKIKPAIITLCILSLLLVLVCCKIKNDNQSPGGTETLTEQERLVQELNQWLSPLGSFPLNLTDHELSFLEELKEPKIVGLGEATHGTREFFQMKHRIFQYLVKYYQHKAIGFEADFAESIYINNYVTGGEGNLEELMRTVMQGWSWRTVEVKELLEWMKNYNTGKPDEEKIHYFGVDPGRSTYQPDLLQDYFLRTVPALWQAASPVLELVRNLSNSDYQVMSETTYEGIKTQLESLENQLIANREQLISNSSTREYEINKQLLKTSKQAFIVLYHRNKDIGSINWRDRFMAENARWIADFFGQDTKITLWAHNGHVARDSDYIADGSMGYHLYETFDNLYQAVGFAFSQGSFTAWDSYQPGGNMELKTQQITTDPRIDSINYVFHQASHPNFVFNLDAIPVGSQWENWLSQQRSFLMIGVSFSGDPANYYQFIDVRGHYNWLIYFDSTNATTLLEDI
jgi:erythromycin esterase